MPNLPTAAPPPPPYGLAHEALAVLDFAPPYRLDGSRRDPFGRTVPAESKRAAVRIFSDEMDDGATHTTGRGQYATVEPVGPFVTAGVYVVVLGAEPGRQSLTVCRLQPQGGGAYRLSYDNAVYPGRVVALPSPAVRPVLRLSGWASRTVGGVPRGEANAAARAAGLIPDWRALADAE